MEPIQKSTFLAGEGDGYWQRNGAHIGKLHAAALSNPSHDPLIKCLAELAPHEILEVGCANGWRLDVAHQLWRAKGTGIDPSANAIADGRRRFPGLDLTVGTADRLPHGKFDCIVFGFCLYLCDRSDLFQIAAEADRALKPGGYIAVFDFFATNAYRNVYVHQAGIYAHKMDYGRMWSWHPSYTIWQHLTTAHEGKDPQDPNERLAVILLRKAGDSTS